MASDIGMLILSSNSFHFHVALHLDSTYNFCAWTFVEKILSGCPWIYNSASTWELLMNLELGSYHWWLADLLCFRDLSDNSLTGNLPASFSSLTSLNSLWVFFSCVSGFLPFFSNYSSSPSIVFPFVKTANFIQVFAKQPVHRHNQCPCRPSSSEFVSVPCP